MRNFKPSERGGCWIAPFRIPTRPAVFLGTLYALGCLLFTAPPHARAGVSLETGSAGIATKISSDGTTGFVLNSADSTLSVIDVSSKEVVGEIDLGESGSTCKSISIMDVNGHVLVGTSTGRILEVDPEVEDVNTVLNVSGHNYSIVVADNYNAGVAAWGVDQSNGHVDSLESSTLHTRATLPYTAVVDMKQAAIDPNSPAAEYTSMIVIAGHGSTKGTSLDTGTYGCHTSTYSNTSVSPTALAVAGDYAYFAVMPDDSSTRYILTFTIATYDFSSTPLASYSGEDPLGLDVAGGFLVAAVSPSGSTGTYIDAFDISDTSNVKTVGRVEVNGDASTAGGLSVVISKYGSVADLVTLCCNVSEDVTENVFADDPEWDSTGTPDSAGSFSETTTSSGGVAASVEPWMADVCNAPTGSPGGMVQELPLPCSSGHSVQYSTGEEIYVLPVLKVPGLGLDLEIDLTYRSRRTFDYRYGSGWFLNQDVRVLPSGPDYVHYNGYGRMDTYTSLGGGSYSSPARHDTTLSTGGMTTLTDRFGTSAQFDPSGERTQLQDRYGNTISYSWAAGKLVGIIDTLGRSYSLSYDGQGRLASITDFASRAWTFVYDYLGQLRRMTTPASTQFGSGRSTYFAYSPNNTEARFRGNLVHVWSPNGDIVQSLRYDENDLVSEETIGPGTTSISYSSGGGSLVTTVEDAVGNTTEWTFDVATAMPTQKEEFTRGLREGEPDSYVTTYSTGANGLIEHAVYPRGNRVDYTYDGDLNLTEIRRRVEDTSTNAETDLVVTREFEGAYDQMTSSTDERGNTTSYTVDAYGNTTEIDRPEVTDPASQTITETFTYDSHGRLTGATDGEGREVSLTYYTSGSHNGYLHEVIRDPEDMALTTTFDYASTGEVTSVVDPRGNETTISVDAEGYVTQIEAPSPLSYQKKITYDANRNVTKIEVENVDRNGDQDGTDPWIDTNFGFDAIDRLVTKTVRLTHSTTATTTYDYDDAGGLTLVTKPEGNKVAYAWDERRLLFTATRGATTGSASTVEWDYDDNGNVVTVTDGRGHATTFAYDMFDRRTLTTNPLGHYVTMDYDESSNLTDVKSYTSGDTMVARTRRYFDEVGRLWKVKQDRFGTGLTTSYPEAVFTHDRGGLLTEVLDPLSNATTRTYDAAGRLLTVGDAEGNGVAYEYDENGNVTQVSRTDHPHTGSDETFVTNFSYDELNRMTGKEEVDRTNGENLLDTSFGYDSRSNLTFRVDAENHPVRWTYDLRDRLLKFDRALEVGETIDDFVTYITEQFEYDGNDRLVTLTDDNFNDTTYGYDALDRSTLTTYADDKYVTRSFDANDNVSGWADQNGTEVTNTYDWADHLTARSVSRGTGVSGTTGETYSYDALGRMLTAVDDDYQVERTYDSVGNMLTDKQGYNVSEAEHWKTVSYAWNDAGAPTGISYPSSFVLGHTRDDVYRLTALVDVNDSSATIASFTWQGLGRLATTTNQNATSTAYSYDGFGRVTTIDHKLSGGSSFHKLEYLYDKVHNRRMEKNSFNSTWVSGLPSAVQSFLNGRDGKGDVYAYDMAYRLVDARYDVADPVSEVSDPGTETYGRLVEYTLDGLGNRSQTSETPPTPATTVTYSADVVNQYTAIGGVSRSHDDNGNVVDDGTHEFVYDYRNHLVAVKESGTHDAVASYKYDALGRRVEKAIDGGATTRYVLDGVEPIEEYDGSDDWQARYMYEDGIDRPRAMDRADQADVDGDSNTTEILRFCYHQQALGSVTEMTDPSGAVVEWVTYDVYGQPTIRAKDGTTASSSPVGNPFLFTGREWDPESGTYFYRARTYDPGAGRFIQRDPAGYGAGSSLCEYADSSPSVKSDPSGLDPSRYHQAREALRNARARAMAARAAVTKLTKELEALLAEYFDASPRRCRGKLNPWIGDDERRKKLEEDIEKTKAALESAKQELGAAEDAVADALAERNAARDELKGSGGVPAGEERQDRRDDMMDMARAAAWKYGPEWAEDAMANADMKGVDQLYDEQGRPKPGNVAGHFSSEDDEIDIRNFAVPYTDSQGNQRRGAPGLDELANDNYGIATLASYMLHEARHWDRWHNHEADENHSPDDRRGPVGQGYAGWDAYDRPAGMYIMHAAGLFGHH